MAVKYSKWPLNITTFVIPRLSKIYQIGIFGMKILHLAALAHA
jgi:hypothetical protein